MNILAIDTATEACSVALQHNGTRITRFEICPQQHSQRLLPMVDEVLKEANITLNDLDLLAFGRGPGSFTGVRIATGMIQGLALGTGLKVAGISTLEAMAVFTRRETETRETDTAHRVLAVRDARRTRQSRVSWRVTVSGHSSEFQPLPKRRKSVDCTHIEHTPP